MEARHKFTHDRFVTYNYKLHTARYRLFVTCITCNFDFFCSTNTFLFICRQNTQGIKSVRKKRKRRRTVLASLVRTRSRHSLQRLKRKRRRSVLASWRLMPLMVMTTVKQRSRTSARPVGGHSDGFQTWKVTH